MFQDRADAGRRLAQRLARYRGAPDCVVIAIPYGGLPVGEALAAALDLPLETLICRKLRCASDHALGAGALSETGDYHLARLPGRERLDERQLREQLEWTGRRIETERGVLRADGSFPSVSGRVVLLVDDGVMTGATMLAALKSLRRLDAARLVAAVPVGPAESLRELAGAADDSEVVHCPDEFGAVRDYYETLPRVTAEEARAALRRACDRRARGSPAP